MSSPEGITVLLIDIEGTTTPIDFVHRVLFPYSSQHLSRFVHSHRHQPEVQQQLSRVRETVAEEGGRVDLSEDEAVAVLLNWIADDRKHPALKDLQGRVWQLGYESGAFTTELYPDVAAHLRRWKQQGRRLCIYSSGSELAQRLLFAHTTAGNLCGLFTHFFDTRVGPKREANSYRSILRQLGVNPRQVLFLSDVPAELDAARTAGLRTCQLVRPGTAPVPDHPNAATFADVDLLLQEEDDAHLGHS